MSRKQGFSGFRPRLVALAVASCFATSTALANPTGAAVVKGQVAIFQNGNLLQITNSPNSIINWQSFSIGANEITRFIQQSQASAVLNRVTGSAGAIDPSVILGALQSNGRVFLVNPSGILFGANARVDVSGLIATSLNLSNADFLANRLNFTAAQGAGSIVNQGNITTGQGGQVYLVGPAVTNSGIITSPNGEVVLAAGNSVELVNPGTPNLRVEITAPDNEARNLGRIVVDSGRAGIYAGLINNSGTIRADSVVSEGGRILLKATKTANLETGSVISASGSVGGSIGIQADVLINGGSINADGGQGGSVGVEARNVLSAGRISADGAQGAGGTVDVQASGRILQTAAAHLSADGATGGGKVTLQAADRVFGSGTLTATGQGAGSAGGEIRVLGNDIVLLGASLDASGDAAGGTILVGGDFQGKNPAVQNAGTNWINFSTTINADARTAGDGGKVIVWSDRETQFYGTISARGGSRSGDGGFIEVSGKENLAFGGMADAGAPNGTPGTLLLDPKFIVIDAAAAGALASFLLADPNPGTDEQFAQHIVVLPNDNVVATDPNDNFAASSAGAVYLFNGTTGALVSTLTGSSTSDFVGSGGVTKLTNGNYVVSSPQWNNATATFAGAVTFGSGTTGISGTVSAANSLVGSTPSDNVGSGGVTALTNGNYVVSSPGWNGAAASVGAVTWGNGTGGTVGAVSATNSLVGSTLNDNVGNSGVTALTNGNYVVSSQNWDGAAANVGAVTWGNGTGGTVGAVSATNSLVGSTLDDYVGLVTALTNGNYVVSSQNWDGAAANVGAVTWGNGTGGTVGAVSAANSLVGSTLDDFVGAGVTALSNGNYVVRSWFWDIPAGFGPAVVDVGAATWGNGTGGTVGAVSAANSLVGSTASDFVGSVGVTALSNGNYVVSSLSWNGAAAKVGAATWGNGAGGTIGAVSAANSLVGSTAFDLVGSGGVTALTNGNYVVSSPAWNGAAASVGAATWGNGLGGTVGAVSAANSLVGSTASDQVGWGGVTALTNGNYVVSSPFWNGAAVQVGAVTWGNGAGGTVGAVSAANSLVGSTAFDRVGMSGVTALTNGNYVVGSADWNGAVPAVGAATWGNGLGGTVGAVSAANSLVGTASNDLTFDTCGDGCNSVVVRALSNGNYVVISPEWDNGLTLNAGAVTHGSGTTGVSGLVTPANSLIGAVAGDRIGEGGITGLSNGNFVVRSPSADNGVMVDAGLVHVVAPFGAVGGQTFAANPSGTVTLTPAAITAVANTGTAVILQANTDITLAAASNIVTNNTGGNGGALTFQAGRSVLLNSSITTDNGDLTIVANDPAAQAANRDPGAGGITMAPGTALNAGTGTVALTVGSGVPGAASGNLVVDNITATNVNLQQVGHSNGSSILRASPSSLIQAAHLLMEVDSLGFATGGTVGTAAAPMRVTVSNLESHTHEASPGIFVDSPTQGLTIGGVPFFSGSVKGVQTVSGGDISITANGAITLQSGTAGCGATGGTGGPICSAGGGNVSVTAAGGVAIDSLLNAGGNLAVTAGGSITQSAPLTVGGTTGINAGANTITLTNLGNDFQSAVSLAGGATQITDANALTLGTLTTGALTATSTGALDLGQGSIGGNLVATSNGGAVTQTGALTVTGVSTIQAGAGAITLTNSGNDFQGAVSLTGGATQITDANALTLGTLTTGALTATSTGALDLGQGSVGGNLVATSNGGAVTQTGALTVTGVSTIQAGAGPITLTNSGNDFQGAVSLTGGATQITDANALTLGTITTGALTVTSTGALDLGQGSVGGNLVATSNGGAVTQSGALTVGGTTGINAGANTITLTNLGNDFQSAVSLAGGTTQITDGNALTLGTLTTGALTATSTGALDLGQGSVGGNLVATSNGGAVTQTGALTVTGVSTIQAGAGPITLTNLGNDFQSAVSLAGGATQITDANALTLGTITTGALTVTSTGALDLGQGSVGGNLVATSNGGAVTQSGALTVGGTTGINAGANTITLTNLGNDFQSAVSLAGGTTQITDGNALTLGTLTTGALTATSTGALDLGQGSVGGNLVATSNGGAVTQTGALTVTGVSTIQAGAGPITLTNASNDFQGMVTASGSDISLKDANALTATITATGTGTLIAGGNLALSGSTGTTLDTTTTGSGTTSFGATAVGTDLHTISAGAVTQSGALTVGGTTGINAGANTITLTNLGNDFQSAVSLAGGTTQITDGNALTLGTLTTGALTATSTGALDLGQGSVGGNLVATSNGGAVTQTGALTVTGVSTIQAGAGAITLINAGNDFQGMVTASGSDISLKDANALTATITATGTGTLVATNGITANTSVGSLSAHNTGSGDILITDSGSGTLALVANSTTGVNESLRADAGNVILNSSKTISIGAPVLASGTVALTSTGGSIADNQTVFADITATGTSLSAASGIGTIANPLETQVGHIILSSAGGEIGVINSGNLQLNGLSSVGSAQVGSTGLLTTGGASTVTSGNLGLSANNGMVINHDLSVGGNLNLDSGVGDLGIAGASVTGTDITLTGNNILIGLTTSTAPTTVAASNLLKATSSGNLHVLGGANASAHALLEGLDVELTVGTVSGFLNIAAGSATARIHSVSPTTITVDFPNLDTGGYFVNGVEGVISSGGTGFFADGQPAVLGQNLVVTYAGLPPPPVTPPSPPDTPPTGGVGQTNDQVVASTNELAGLPGGNISGEGEGGSGTGGSDEGKQKKALPICGK